MVFKSISKEALCTFTIDKHTILFAAISLFEDTAVSNTPTIASDSEKKCFNITHQAAY